MSALPKRDTTIKINTAPALVLASLDEKLDVVAVQNLLDRRNANLEHFSNVNALWELDGFQAVDSAIRNEFTSLLGVQSHYFKAKIEVVLGERKRQFSSDLVRSEKCQWAKSGAILSISINLDLVAVIRMQMHCISVLKLIITIFVWQSAG